MGIGGLDLHYEKSGPLTCVVVFFNVGVHLKCLLLSLSSPHLKKPNALSSELEKTAAGWSKHLLDHTRINIHGHCLGCFPQQLYVIKQAASNRQGCNIR